VPPCLVCAGAIRRAWMSRKLVRAVIESVAENASDAVVAPFLWGAVGGLPGFLGYRAPWNAAAARAGRRAGHSGTGR